MCQQVYLGSAKILPEIEWNTSQPQFYVKAAARDEETTRVQKLLATPWLYVVGSFMGCSCGLICDSSFKQQEPETYEQRLRDMLLLQHYLARHAGQNELKLFATSWRTFPDVYPQAVLSLATLDAASFDLPDDIVLVVNA